MKIGPLFLDAAAMLVPVSAIEGILLQNFNRWYFGLGPALLRRTAEADGPCRPDEFASAVNETRYLVAKQTDDDTVLVRRGRSVRLFGWELVPFWSPRLRVMFRPRENGLAVHLELRYTICWPTFLTATGIALVLFAQIALFAREAAATVLLMLPAGAIALYLYVAAVNARNDARHMWELAKQHLGCGQ